MLNLIAKAIHASLIDAPSVEADSEWDGLPAAGQAPYFTAARRILHVMRSPTGAMLGEGNRSKARDAGNIWEVMIYRALHEEG